MPGLVAAAQNPRAGVSIPESHRTVISTSVDILDMQGNNIGYITNFSPTHDRAMTKIRHLNSLDAGRVVEMSPGPSNVTITVGGFALYNKQNDGSLIQRLGGGSTKKAMRMLEEQTVPFLIVEVETHPKTGDKTAIGYHMCWLSAHGSPKNIGTVTIAETATIQVGWADDYVGDTEVVLEAQSGIADQGEA